MTTLLYSYEVQAPISNDLMFLLETLTLRKDLAEQTGLCLERHYSFSDNLVFLTYSASLLPIIEFRDCFLF